ncbi:MAG: RNA-binding protein [Candidatus Altiarchaeales archaeon]|nr:MAG: RNA-binding protein [Candidatus Altiarchaeales archaeon]RLI93656.1 MAG: RNA-binding protein [Candidatus Altiarchaeales archaeon]HDO82618.1 DUF1610 domain-containing protein [Candidatus Altiarchaeales archaeon]HEX55267.1 DUF1610 domain-containing protein [Candidatus Altiarchaeales archaeon]
MEVKKCVSCGVEVGPGYTEFYCPKCGKSRIVRCARCRAIGAAYICSECGFEGP